MSTIINEKPGKVCQKRTVSVIGGHDATAEVEQISHDIGILVAEVGCVLVCGGLSGVMEAACKGAKKAGGLTIGLLPGTEKIDANPYVDIALPTSLGFARNACVACSSDIIIALPGSHGTNSEICYGLVYKRPVIDFGDWNIKGMIPVKDIKELESVLKELIRGIKRRQ